MKETEVLIVGQGLAGTWLSWWLYQAGISFKVIDQFDPDGASVRAAGLINPVTGRRMVTTWMIDELMPFAEDAYQGIGKFLNESFFDKTSIVDFFPSVQMLQAFQKRLEEDPAYLFQGEDRDAYSDWFQYDFGWGSIQPCFLIRAEKLLAVWRGWLKKNDLLKESLFDYTKLVKESDAVQFADIHARYIVFCDGRSSAQNPYFEKLPFALNKGEAMLVEIKGLPKNQIFKKGMSLVPWKDNVFWLGSSYEWSFADDRPSENFRKTAEIWLKVFLKLPFTVLDHFAAIRPATLERRPFVGFHPLHPQIGILNGMGTKGCSLAPYFAKQLADQIAKKGIIDPPADIRRFERILSSALNH
jgi:glycine/D-amino acid oxidase-like deaminating enzyme